jgi:hypothetical protein
MFTSIWKIICIISEMPIISKESILSTVSEETCWMVSQRMNKLREELHTSMSISPFLLPILFDLHHAGSFEELGSLLLAGQRHSKQRSWTPVIDENILLSSSPVLTKSTI